MDLLLAPQNLMVLLKNFRSPKEFFVCEKTRMLHFSYALFPNMQLSNNSSIHLNPLKALLATNVSIS